MFLGNDKRHHRIPTVFTPRIYLVRQMQNYDASYCCSFLPVCRKAHDMSQVIAQLTNHTTSKILNVGLLQMPRALNNGQSSRKAQTFVIIQSEPGSLGGLLSAPSTAISRNSDVVDARQGRQ